MNKDFKEEIKRELEEAKAMIETLAIQIESLLKKCEIIDEDGQDD